MQKARDALHLSWEKYSSLSHLSNLQEVWRNTLSFLITIDVRHLLIVVFFHAVARTVGVFHGFTKKYHMVTNFMIMYDR